MILYSGLWGRLFGPGGEVVMNSGGLEVNRQIVQMSEDGSGQEYSRSQSNTAAALMAAI